MAMLNVCPLTKSGQRLRPMDGRGYVILYPELGDWARRGAVSRAETLGEFMEREGATSDYPVMWGDPTAFVVWANQPTNTYCGGEVIHALGIAREETFGQYGTRTVYLSRQQDGSLKLAIPA